MKDFDMNCLLNKIRSIILSASGYTLNKQNGSDYSIYTIASVDKKSDNIEFDKYELVSLLKYLSANADTTSDEDLKVFNVLNTLWRNDKT